MSDLGDFHGGGTPSSSVERYWQGNIPWISSSDLKEGNINLINPSRFITEEAIINSATKLLNAPALLIVSRVGVGKVALSSNDVCTSQDFTNICSIKCIPKFLAYSTLILMKRAANQVQGTSIKGISSSEIKSKIIFLPNEEEQIKISDFISVIDSKIETQRKTITHLETLIKTYIDQIFEQKLSFNPNHENWQMFKLEELGNTFNGLTGKTKEDFGSGKKFIQYKQIFDSPQIKMDDCGYVQINENENQQEVKYGDSFFTISSETPNEIGMSSILLDEVQDTFLNSFCFGFRFNSFAVLNPVFASFLFRSSLFRNQITKLAQGSTRYNMSKSEFLKISVEIPNEQEQTKIAGFLSKISNRIETEKRILELFEQQKKYLLQNLFV